MTRRRRHQLTGEDRALWEKVTRTVEPLHPVVRAGAPEPEAEPKPAKPRIVKGAASLSGPATPKPLAPRSPRAIIDSPTRKRIAKGRLPIDGRIDLHGMTQAEAHVALLAFLSRAHGDGRRHALVITGKGASLGSDGALARAVPSWLGTSPFAALVSGWSPASRRHGGDGALYVKLRRTGRAAS